MKDCLYAWKEKKTLEMIIVKTEIRRDKHDPKVYNSIISKHYGVIYDKRRVLPDLTTLPYGFISN